MKHYFSRGPEDALVATTKGTVRGYCYDGLLIFKGIPYAKAKRFHAPEPMEPWEGILDAGSYGMVCPLMTNERPKGELLVPHRYWPMDENCQNLNIWTPATDDGKRPVLVWLHGGGFYAGSSIEQVAYDGANMARLGDAVVVSLNHRLNILGYLDLSEYGAEYANSGNAGGDDIIAALSWIHDNIAAFGGDPDNVTVFGQSGGGAKVTTLLQSPAADGLFSKGVVMSGVLDKLMNEREDSAKPLVEGLLRELNLTDVRQLETVDYVPLSRAYQKVSKPLEEAGKYVGGLPRKNAFYLGTPSKNGFRPETAHIPLLVGSTFGEFAPFVHAPSCKLGMTEKEQETLIRETLGEERAEKLIALFAKAYPERNIADVLDMDFLFRQPQIPYIAERSRLNSCTWSYLFNMDQPIEGRSTPWHCSDIPFFFHNIDLVEHPHGKNIPEDLAQRLEEQMFGLLMAFARTGNPQLEQLPLWEASTAGYERTLILDANPRVLVNHDHILINELTDAMEQVMQRSMETNSDSLQH